MLCKEKAARFLSHVPKSRQFGSKDSRGKLCLSLLLAVVYNRFGIFFYKMLVIFRRAGNGNPEKGQNSNLRSCKAYEGYFWYLRLGMAANHMVVTPNTHHIVHSSLLSVKIEFQLALFSHFFTSWSVLTFATSCR